MSIIQTPPHKSKPGEMIMINSIWIRLKKHEWNLSLIKPPFVCGYYSMIQTEERQ